MGVKSIAPQHRAIHPIPVEPQTPWEREQQKLLQVRVGRTYQKPASPTATSSRGLARVAGVKVGGGGRITGNSGFIPDSMAPKAGL